MEGTTTNTMTLLETAPLLTNQEVTFAYSYGDNRGGDAQLLQQAESEASSASTLAGDEPGAIILSPQHRTNVWETFIHLIKGYIGAGMLSLPWAFSCLGVKVGVLGVCTLGGWTSYNCFTVVSIKRYMERLPGGDAAAAKNNNNNNTQAASNDDRNSETSSNLTYPDIGMYVSILFECVSEDDA